MTNESKSPLYAYWPGSISVPRIISAHQVCFTQRVMFRGAGLEFLDTEQLMF